MKPVRIFGREPALWVGFIAAVLGGLATTGIDGLSPLQAAGIIGGINALAAIITAWQVRPVAPAIYTNAVAAGVAIATAYGQHATPELVGSYNAIVLAGLMLLTRGQVSPTGAAVAVAPPAAPPVIAASTPQAAARLR